MSTLDTQAILAKALQAGDITPHDVRTITLHMAPAERRCALEQLQAGR